jgi:hypothetical protein
MIFPLDINVIVDKNQLKNRMVNIKRKLIAKDNRMKRRKLIINRRIILFNYCVRET